MKTCTKCKEDKPSKDFNRGSRFSDGLQPYCRLCSNAKNKSWYKENSVSHGINGVAWVKNNPEARAKIGARWAANNAEYFRAAAAKRRAAKLLRTPPWADHDAIDKVYADCRELEELAEQKLHVDHIVPLQGELVSGLHVPANLQIITAKENLSKHNKFEVAA